MTEVAWEIPLYEDERAQRVYLDPMDDAPLEERVPMGQWYRNVGRAANHAADQLRTASRGLRRVYGETAFMRSERARNQFRDSKGRFCKERAPGYYRGLRGNVLYYDEYKHWHNSLGQFALKPAGPMERVGKHEDPNRIPWRPPQTITATTPVYQWQTTTATTGGIYIPQQYTMTGGTTTATTVLDQVRMWRNEYEMHTYVTNGTDTWYQTDEDAQNYNWRVYRQLDEMEEERQRLHRLEREYQLQAQRDEQQRQREEQSRRQLAARQLAVGAQERAIELLKMILNPEERMRFENTGKFFVRGSQGGLYEIDTTYWGVHGNIIAMDEHGCRLGRLCVAPQMFDSDYGAALPLADGWIGQYLSFKHNEPEILRHANWSDRRRCQNPEVPVMGIQVA